MNRYIGQEKFRELHPIVDKCCKLEGDVINNLHLRNDNQSNDYWRALKKINESDFIVWLSKQENFKEAKKILIDNNIIRENTHMGEKEFISSFEHLCLMLFSFMTHMAQPKNIDYLLKKRQSKLLLAKNYFDEAAKIIYPGNYISDEFKNAKNQLEKEINDVSDLKYR